MKNKGNLIFAMVMTLIVVAAIGGMVFMKQKNDKADTVQETKQVTAKDSGASKDFSKIDTSGQPMAGKKDAKVTMIEFGDFKCPACKYFDEKIKPDVLQKYIDKGDLNLYFIHTPFHQEESFLGGYAGESVLKHDASKYWAFHKALFNAQPNTEHSTSEPWLTMKVIEKALDTAKVKDKETIIKDIKDSKEEKAVQKDVDLVQKYQVTSTPTVVVDGKVLDDPMNEKKVKAAIEKALK